MTEPERKYSIAIGRDPAEVARIQRDEMRKVRIVDPETGKRVTVWQRLDPLEVLFRRHPDEFPEEIRDAARRAQRLFEIANAAGPQSLDLSRPRVDGGATEPLSAARVAAYDELRRVEAEIGKAPAALLRAVLHEGKSFAQVARERARRRGRTAAGERAARHIGYSFRETLADLSDFWS
jgi:hypothetical protein